MQQEVGSSWQCLLLLLLRSLHVAGNNIDWSCALKLPHSPFAGHDYVHNERLQIVTTDPSTELG